MVSVREAVGTRSRVVANVIRFRMMIRAPKIAIVVAQPLAEIAVAQLSDELEAGAPG